MGFFKNLKEKVFGKSSKQNDKYVAGLDKSSAEFSSKLNSLTARYRHVDEAYFEELEEILIEADVGVELAMEIVDASKKQCMLEGITDPKETNEILVDKIFVFYANSATQIDTDIKMNENGPTVILMVGVNGVGKTTSIAKLTKKFQDEGKKVLWAAGDTFRAGAVAQLQVWADRLNVRMISGKENGDPSSVMFEAARIAKEENYDVLFCDTAGRLQTKVNLMNELAKMRRVIAKEIETAPHEVLLVLDATTGQNGVLQAKAFFEATGIDGIVLTKMDGTSKGGIILSIMNELHIPVKYVGVGEGMDDLLEFDLENYIYGLTKGIEK